MPAKGAKVLLRHRQAFCKSAWTDRAHRIGQERPVTVYRLVARHTIEAKILALHEKKRTLAESLLEGVDVSGKVSVQELIGLLRDRS